MAEIRDAVLVDFARTPFGVASKKKPGFFADKRADDLAAIVVEKLLERTGIDPASVDELIMGTVNQIGEQANPGRSVCLMTLPPHVAGLSVDRACCSSMTAAHISSMAIQLGLGDIFIAAGMESHSHFPTPMITEDTDLVALAEELSTTRGNPNPRIFDRIDISAMVSMGLNAETLAERYGITREDQDQWAWKTSRAASAAVREGKFKHEIIPMEGTLRDGTVQLVDYDQGIIHDSRLEKIRSLPPLYKPGGTITAASASGENDGAGAAILMSKQKAIELGLVPMFTIRAMAWTGVDPMVIGLGAVVAARKAMERSGLKVADLDLVEVNEAYASLPLLVIKELCIDPDKMNVNGSACCIGHPTGVSGIRILGTLAHEMNRRGSKYGLAAICGAWGAGAATVVEREDYWEGRRTFIGE